MKKVKNANGVAILRDGYDIALQDISRARFVVDKNAKAMAIVADISEPGEGPEIVQIAIGYGDTPYIQGLAYKNGMWTSLGKAYLS